jgi:hypothetical protein
MMIMRYKATGSASADEFTVEVSASDTKLYATKGVGVEYAVGKKSGIFVQGTFNVRFEEEDDETIWLTTQAGVRFRL